MKALNIFFCAAVVAGCCSVPEKAASENPAPVVTEPSPTLVERKNVPFKLGLARYTFRRQSFDRALAVAEKLDCHYMGLMGEAISFDADDAAIAALKAKCAAKGVEIVSAGPLYYSTEEELEACCKFAKRYGMKYISVVPFDWNAKIAHLGNGTDAATYDARRAVLPDAREWRVESDKMMDALERMVRKYDLKAAVHNHGPDNALLYSTAEAALRRIGERDKRIGVCLDVGHNMRAGADPVEFIKKHGERIVEVHLKNIKVDPVANLAKEGPRGELDIEGIMKALAEQGFDGYCLVEYEKGAVTDDMELAETFGYFRGVKDSIKAKAALEPTPAGANTLTAAEKAQGWKLLFDGKNLPKDVFVGVRNNCEIFPEKGWYVKDGYLSMRPLHFIDETGNWKDYPPEDMKLAGGGDIVTKKFYKDFIFEFDFRMTEKANSGVKYFFNEKLNSGSCEEYQILDSGHPDYFKGKDGNRQVAALYDLISTKGAADVVIRPVGKWNHGRIVSKGAHVEHWLNGVKVLEYERGGEAFRAAVAASKYATWGKDADGKAQPWGELAEGRLQLQDHTDSIVAFCNLKVKEL